MPIDDDDGNPSIVSHASCGICGVMNPPGGGRCLRAVLLLCNSVPGSRDGVMPGCAVIYSACYWPFLRLFDILRISISPPKSGLIFSSCSSPSVWHSSSSSSSLSPCYIIVLGRYTELDNPNPESKNSDSADLLGLGQSKTFSSPVP